MAVRLGGQPRQERAVRRHDFDNMNYCTTSHCDGLVQRTETTCLFWFGSDKNGPIKDEKEAFLRPLSWETGEHLLAWDWSSPSCSKFVFISDYLLVTRTLVRRPVFFLVRDPARLWTLARTGNYLRAQIMLNDDTDCEKKEYNHTIWFSVRIPAPKA